MRKNNIVAVIPIKKKSVRIKNKNFLPFFGSKSLLEVKILQLKKVKRIDKIIISSDSEEAKKMSQKHKIGFHKRENYYASPKCSGSEFFENLARSIDANYIAYCPCTSPIIFQKTYNAFFENFYKFKKKFDSFNSAGSVHEFLWKGRIPVNYNPQKAPNSQDLSKKFVKLTFGLNIISRKNMIKYKNIVGKKPNFYILNKDECVDIDDPDDLELAKILYRKNNLKYKNLI